MDSAEAAMQRIAELEAQIERMGEVMLDMATRLDAYERQEAESGPEITEWFGTAQWSGSVADYNANSGEINHQLALEIQKMAVNAENHRNPPNTAHRGQKEADRALPQAAQSIEAHGVEDPPEGRSYTA